MPVMNTSARLAGTTTFHKFTVNWDGYQQLFEDLTDRKTVLGLHGYAGYIPDDSPFFERFYAGGIGSIRGFRFRGVGPRDGRGLDPIGGNFIATGSAEVNFPIYSESLRGVVFSDFGDVEPEFHFGTIRSSIGAGIRLVLPFLGQTRWRSTLPCRSPKPITTRPSLSAFRSAGRSETLRSLLLERKFHAILPLVGVALSGRDCVLRRAAWRSGAIGRACPRAGAACRAGAPRHRQSFRIFKDIQETKSMRDKLEARRKELLAKEMELRQNIETLTKQRADINPNHPKWRELTDQIFNAKATLQSWGAANKASVELDQKMMVKTLFDKIEASIAEVAQQNNIDIVIADGRRDIEGIEDMSFEDLQRVLSTRNVLYANKGFDLSEKVITLMDAKFAKEKK